MGIRYSSEASQKQYKTRNDQHYFAFKVSFYKIYCNIVPTKAIFAPTKGAFMGFS